VALILLTLTQAGGLFIFVKGFLLTRVALPDQSTSTSLPPKFKRAVILIIDALRFDFLFPAQNATEVYHNVLTTPGQLTREQPRNGFMAKFLADPPTATLQRIKGLTVGTLPTFVDIGSSFNGQAIEDDNWLAQAQKAGKVIAFMGDDTWLSTFPPIGFSSAGALHPDLIWPYDSFNVEDLDTVDHGVRKHLYPLLETATNWDILIAHCLGLDHVGHRMGSKHPEMARKLREANEMVDRIISSLRDDDLLVVMGDHGMDAQGNHGGDSPEEVSAGLWLYSKTPLLTDSKLDTEDTFLHDGHIERQVQQISFTPTFSLLMGLPIPFSNLGSIIPELFLAETEKKSWKGITKELDYSTLKEAIRLNTQQIKTFLHTYASDDLKPQIQRLLHLHEEAEQEKDPQKHLQLSFEFMREVQAACRSIWATFDMLKMAVGLFILASSLLVILRLVRLTSYEGCLLLGTPIRTIVNRGVLAHGAGLLAGVPVGLYTKLPLFQAMAASSSIASSIALLWPVKVRIPLAANKGTTNWSEALLSLLALVHAGSFGSNSFIMWEDRVSLYLVQIPLLLLALQALAAPAARLRTRIGLCALVAMVSIRLVAISTICREEQQPYCSATFHLPASLSSSYAYSGLAASFLCAWILPSVATYFLDLADANQGIAPFYFAFGFRGSLLLGSSYWAIEWLIGALPSETGSLYLELLTTIKNGVAISLYTAVAGCIVLIWYSVSSLNLGVRKEEVPASGGQEARTRIQLLGFANSLGSTYLVLFSSIFSLFFLLSQPVGQIALSLSYVVILCLIEGFDSKNDVGVLIKQLQEPGGTSAARAPSFPEVAALVLLGNLLFFATGHQAVLSSIQWKMAFVGSKSVVYPFSPILVVLNTLGPYIFSAAAIPLLVFWNVSPSIRNGPTLPLVRHLFRACLLFMLYHSLLTLPASFFAAWHRRHLMVWKVFAPRFMLSGITLLAVDMSVVGVAYLGGLATLRKASSMLGSQWS
jgi:phosphatidylinositol glycan class O